MDKSLFLKCPRSHLVRKEFQILDGVWSFSFDKNNKGEKLNYQNGFKKQYDILVPFVYQTKKSGINIQESFDYVWYQRHFDVQLDVNKRYLLHLEGIDYINKVYVNGIFVGADRGAYHRHTYDITSFLKNGSNLLVIKCEDDYSKEKLRGKQRSRDESYECWYVDTTGIYKSVWIETVNKTYLKEIKITPFLKEKRISFVAEINAPDNGYLTVLLKENDRVIKEQSIQINDGPLSFDLNIDDDLTPWDLDNPYLYDLEFIIRNNNDEILDKSCSYVGFRELESRDKFIYLNGKKLYQKLVLDQGYFMDSGLTAPGIEKLKEDILLMKEFGFNGCRKHEKIEDERFLFFADTLGYLVWEEIPSFYQFSNQAKENYYYELPFILKQNYNHPSIIVWTLFNESWGVGDILFNKEQQEFVNEMYRFVKEFDSYRFVITNDGWEHTISDIITIHHYMQDGNKLFKILEDENLVMTEIWKEHHKGAFADGYKYNNQPVIISEFGGTAFVKNTQNGNWGYGEGVKDDDEYIQRLDSLFNNIKKIDYVCGYCYTQVSDVEQEVNGLLTHDHKPKIAPEALAKIQNEK